jgi:hypothetical protein
VIVDIDATTAIRQAEVTAATRMIERSREQFGLYRARFTVDSSYRSAPILSWLVHDQGIEPHIPVLDKSQRRDGTFSRADFAYDRGRSIRLPRWQGALAVPPHLRHAPLGRRSGRLYALPSKQTRLRRLRAQATVLPQGAIHEGTRDMASDILATNEGRASRRQRKKFEMLFAHLKSILKNDRL